MLKEQWPEGGQDILKVTKRPQTTATIFKNSMVSLTDNLMKKVYTSRILFYLFTIMNINLLFDVENLILYNIF